MSEPVSNVDIEDVLASIRRLVSGGVESDRIDLDHEKDAERLVLTPSQRVDEPEESDSTETPTESHDDAPDMQADAAADLDLVQAEAGSDRAQAADASDQSEREAADDSGEIWTAPGALEEEGAASVPQSLEEAEETAPVAEADVAREDVWMSDLSARAAGDQGAQSGGWEPDGDDEDAFAEGAQAPTLEWRDAEEEAEEDAPSADPDNMAADRGASAAFARDWDSGARASGEAMRAAPLDIDEAVLDEEALRDLVAEIVRAELMGTLGERITRNVRKLVRREIHRALTCQEFD